MDTKNISFPCMFCYPIWSWLLSSPVLYNTWCADGFSSLFRGHRTQPNRRISATSMTTLTAKKTRPSPVLGAELRGASKDHPPRLWAFNSFRTATPFLGKKYLELVKKGSRPYRYDCKKKAGKKVSNIFFCHKPVCRSACYHNLQNTIGVAGQKATKFDHRSDIQTPQFYLLVSDRNHPFWRQNACGFSVGHLSHQSVKKGCYK